MIFQDLPVDRQNRKVISPGTVVSKMADTVKKKCDYFDEIFFIGFIGSWSLLKLSIQPVMKILSKWYFHFSAGEIAQEMNTDLKR